MAKPPPPPLALETLDGSRACAAAADREDWREVHSQDGHPHHFPPEIAHLAAEGADWQTLQDRLRPALVAREQAARELAAREQAEREQAEREQAEREQAEREQAEREQAAQKPPREHGAALTTRAAHVALGVYAVLGEEFKDTMSTSSFARLAATFAQERGIKNADLLSPEGGTMREMASEMLEGLRKARKSE